MLPVAAAPVCAWHPQLAARCVPVLLIFYGLYGLVILRVLTIDGPDVHCGAVTIGAGQDLGNYLVLPQAYGILLLGTWLALRDLARHPRLARRVLGAAAPAPDAQPGRRASLRPALLASVLPLVLVMAADLVLVPWAPGTADFTTAMTLALTSALLAAPGLAAIRWQPALAAQLAVAGLIAFGLAGMLLELAYGHSWTTDAAFPHQYGLVLLYGRHAPGLAQAQAVVLIVLGACLAPLVFPAMRRVVRLPADPELARRVERLAESRAVAVDTAASELRRLERDLHDGAQVRLVALGMSLRAAERLIGSNPDAATALVAQARDVSARALTELRELVRGIHPPVLADRGLADAVRALALDCPLAVVTNVELPGRPPAPVEAACYFAVAELLANAAKHSGAREARIDIHHDGRMLRVEVTDYGLGGANPAAGSGLAGVEKRLAAFDGIMAVSSPPGGPTIVVLEVPCALSWAKISSC
jgi:signal transduction histidine kinase